MSSIYELSDRELFQLKSIDPHLSGGWQELLFQVLPKLDKDNQLIIKEDILAPRGIHYDRENQRFYAEKAKTLAEVLKESGIHNKELLRLIEYMLETLAPINEPICAEEVADRIESILSQLNNISFDDSDKPKIRYEVLKAFLYDIAKWVDNVELKVKAGVRKMNAEIAKIYLKEVFIKQQIQGWDFRSWDAMDIWHMPDIPDWVKEAVKTRKCYMIETNDCWFLIGQAETAEQNPFSFRRFLYEDDGGGGYRAFVNHVAIPRALINNADVVKLLKRSIGRIYTLDKTISGAISKFVYEMKEQNIKNLRPLLKQPLKHDGTDIEKVIQTRLLDYEKQLTRLVLMRLPKVMQTLINTEDDKNYLFYHLKVILKQMIESVEDFRLQPITRFSASVDMMVLKLTCYSLLLDKVQDILCHKSIPEKDKTDQLNEPLTILTGKLEEVVEDYEQLVALQEKLLTAQNSEGGFFSRLFKRQPDYTMEDIQQEALKLSENLFMFIVRLEKHHRRFMAYPEFEIYKSFNDNYRHYAFANGVMGIDRLPKLLRLPEDKKQFQIRSVQQVVYYDVIKGFRKVVV